MRAVMLTARRNRWSFGGEGGCKALCKGGPKFNRRGETVHQESKARSRPGSPSGERTRSGFLHCGVLHLRSWRSDDLDGRAQRHPARLGAK